MFKTEREKKINTTKLGNKLTSVYIYMIQHFLYGKWYTSNLILNWFNIISLNIQLKFWNQLITLNINIISLAKINLAQQK